MSAVHISVISRRLPTMNSVGCIYILHHTFDQGENSFPQNIQIHAKSAPRMILSFDKLRFAYYCVERQTSQTEDRYNNKSILYLNLHINPTVSYTPVLYLSLHRCNYKLQISLVCIHTQIQWSAIDQSCIYTYNGQL